jgi:hypothetical protein
MCFTSRHAGRDFLGFVPGRSPVAPDQPGGSLAVRGHPLNHSKNASSSISVYFRDKNRDRSRLTRVRPPSQRPPSCSARLDWCPCKRAYDDNSSKDARRNVSAHGSPCRTSLSKCDLTCLKYGLSNVGSIRSECSLITRSIALGMAAKVSLSPAKFFVLTSFNSARSFSVHSSTSSAVAIRSLSIHPSVSSAITSPLFR